VGEEGALGDPYTTGTFGGDFLRPFRAVFDHPRRRIGLFAKAAERGR
jgi:hypothetical protein